VSAVTVTFTVVSPATGGTLHADKDESSPNATVSYMNYLAGQTQSNTGTVAVAADGKIQLTRDTAGTYSYDTLGRATSIPGGDATGVGSHASITGGLTVGYYASDMVATEDQGGVTDSFTLDPDQNRIDTQTDNGTTTTKHYSDDGDSHSWTQTGSGWTEYAIGPDGNLATVIGSDGTVELQLADLHGDIVATLADGTTATYNETTEYGTPRVSEGAYDTYGYLGGKQRSANDLAGLIIMGVRLYEPTTGRFESVDPVPGGNANSYIYPDDPIGRSGTSGKTNNVNGHHCSWYFCDIRLSNSKSLWLASRLDDGAVGGQIAGGIAEYAGIGGKALGLVLQLLGGVALWRGEVYPSPRA